MSDSDLNQSSTDPTVPVATEHGAAPVRIGLNTFGDVPSDGNGDLLSHAEALRQVVAEAVLADRSGVDDFLVGEHHRADYAISAPETVLAGIATRTERIRLGSGVTVLSSDDPVRVFQRFATLDALSHGRAEVILGRGSFTESFPLFGYDLADYETLFEEKIDLFSHLLTEEPVTWQGNKRASLTDADVYPKTESGKLETWVGVGGSPQSVVRAAHYRFPLMLAIIGGGARRFAPYIDLFQRATEQFGGPSLPVGVHSPGFVAETDEQAREILWPYHQQQRDLIGRDRGWPPMQRAEFESEIAHGSLYVGSPESVATKIADTISALGIDRFDMVYTSGAIPAADRLRAVELYGTEVIPRVRELLAEKSAADKS
ncbi:LLM class flavin-dependent oxidoreductase [Naumannella halotolerans]|uniref:LLM class flavin-dependent oxidoreductase n=1 Tax=Naumannella halotolerans TaxID=993414 RepID=UPI00370D68D9